MKGQPLGPPGTQEPSGFLSYLSVPPSFALFFPFAAASYPIGTGRVTIRPAAAADSRRLTMRTPPRRSAAPRRDPQNASAGHLGPEAVAGGLNHPADGAFRV